MTYNNNRKLIEQLLIESAKMTEGILSSTSSSTISITTKPYVILKIFDDYGATYELRAYTKRPNEYQKLQSEIRKMYRYIPKTWIGFNCSSSSDKHGRK